MQTYTQALLAIHVTFRMSAKKTAKKKKNFQILNLGVPYCPQSCEIGNISDYLPRNCTPQLFQPTAAALPLFTDLYNSKTG